MDSIVELIEAQNGKITFKALLKKLDIDKYKLMNDLEELKLAGKILQVGNKYMMFPDDVFLGNISISSSNKQKYILHDNRRVPIAADFFNAVKLNDIVSFKINDDNFAEIISIVKRHLDKAIGEVVIINGKKKIKLYGKNDFITFTTNNKETMDNLSAGDIILVLNSYDDESNTNNYKYVDKIGRSDDPLIDDLVIALDYGFDNNYTPEFMEEIKKLPTEVTKEELIGRMDYRNQASFTIDGAYTKDMDDGVYGEMLDDNIIRIYVHIADVSHYIKEDSEIFRRATEKTTSLYMNNSVFHMFHHTISNGICSLNPGVDRLTKTVIMDIDKDGKIINYDIKKAVINSKMKMVYNDVDIVLTDEEKLPEYHDFRKTLFILYDAALRLEKKFINVNGKINFASNEMDITYNDDGTIKSIDSSNRCISEKIIENLMIAANNCVANYISYLDLPMVYRVHELPNLSKINEVIMELNHEGYNIHMIKNVDSPKVLQKILNDLSTYPEYPIISQMLVMAMQRARYSTENVGHYALGIDKYCHFTSPIRRLPDLLVHMILDAVLTEYDKLDPQVLAQYEELFNELCPKASRMERQADAAEKVAEEHLIVKKLAKNMDEIYDATVIKLGSKIRLRIEGIDVDINAHELDSLFSFDSKKKRYFDMASGIYIKFRTKLQVKVTGVNTTDGKINVKVIGLSEETLEEGKKKVLVK